VAAPPSCEFPAARTAGRPSLLTPLPSRVSIPTLLSFLSLLSLLSLPVVPAAAQTRSVAITIDDLPLNAGPPALACDAPGLTDLHERTLAALAAAAAPAVGFVNEGRACDASVLETLLERWLDAGHLLGNHTATHPDLTRSTIEEYARDIEAGEPMLRRLLRSRGDSLVYFRHPFLRTGETREKKEALAAYLDRRGYVVAPVTIDSDEWVFASAYSRAVAAGDTAGAQRVLAAYVPWFEEVVAHFEGWSIDVLGHEPPQVLLLHVNLLNAEALPALLAMLQRRGYRFVSLAEALAALAYAREDTFVGRFGSSWLHRWARAEPREVRWEPDAPDWVERVAR